MSDETFETSESGASLTFPLAASSLKKGHLLVMDGRPCKIVEISFAKTGKHGHAKASITGIDIFNGKKREDSVPGGHNMECPNAKRKEWQLLDVQGDYVTLMNETGETREDLKLPSDTEKDAELCKKINDLLEEGKECMVTILSSMEIEKIVDVKETNN